LQELLNFRLIMYDALQQQEVVMTLKEWFATQPRGARTKLAKQLGVSKTWMCQITAGRDTPSAELVVAIHKLTNGQVSRESLRPDLFA